MNKYYESLDFIVKNSCPSHMSCKQCHMNKICNNLVKPHIDRLQELVERATPKKPIKSEEQDIRYVTKYECPNCHQYFTGKISKYCYHCGQALDWSEENEE